MRRVVGFLGAFVLAACTQAPPAGSGTISMASPTQLAAPTTVATATSQPSAQSGSPAPDDGPTALPNGPGWTPRPYPDLLIGSAVRVAVAELNVRELPSLTASVIGVATPGHIFSLGAQPIEASGYTWYPADVISDTGQMPLLTPDGYPRPEGPGGWLAVSGKTGTFVERMAPRCPQTTDLDHVANMLPAEHLACFGGNSLVLEGLFGCYLCGYEGPGTHEPRWLAHPVVFSELKVFPAPLGPRVPLMLRFPPGGPTEPAQGSVVRVQGHFDDDRARECSIALPLPDADVGDEDIPLDAALAELICRQRFVVERVEVLGTDPTWGQ